MSKCIAVVTASIVIFAPTMLVAKKYNTTGEILRRCEATDTQNVAYCLGYLKGIHEGYDLFSGERTGSTKYCIPNGMTLDQASKVFVEWVNDNPTKLHYPAAQSAIEAWLKAFPCANSIMRKD